jgi:hypothetical protein
VTVVSANSPEAQQIDRALSAWRQGDVALQERWFVHAAAPGLPLTDEANTGAEAETESITSEVDGLVMVTQTCDIARKCTDRPYVEVSPLVEIKDEGTFAEIRRSMRPNYLLVPSLESRRLVGHLDRTMTVEKAVVASWARTDGCHTDQQRLDFASGLARKRSRTAFPDDFNRLLNKLKKRIKECVGNDSDEGMVLRALEIRVAARPDWDASPVDILFLFVLHEDECELNPSQRDPTLQNCIDELMALVKIGGRFGGKSALPTTMARMSAADYTSSALLDLDHLSP